MDRLDDLLKATSIYSSSLPSDNHTFSKSVAPLVTVNSQLILPKDSTIVSESPFMTLATKISRQLCDNDNQMQRMSKLVCRKEFSNDPTQEMAEISATFERVVKAVQSGLNKLTQFELANTELPSQPRQHLKSVLQQLRFHLSSQVEQFKTMLKTHATHVRQRQERVSRYGAQGTTALSSSGTGVVSNNSMPNEYPLLATQGYAMFSSSRPPATVTTSSLGQGGPGELRRRGHTQQHQLQQHGNGPGHSNSRSGGVQPMAMLTANPAHRYQDVESFRSAQKVEETITQMGELFAQMSSLVMEQSATVQRIEDDVEVGLTNTEEAHRSMEQVYALTKGNRAIIIKVFLLLVVFVVLFLVLT